jgi:flagellar export protein FliJ
MAQFRYRLATLLRLREATRDEKRTQLADAQRAARILEDQISEIDAEFSDSRQQSQTATRPGEINVDHLIQVHRYERVLQAQRAAIVSQLKLVTAEIDKRRLALVEADRQVQVLEKLRERQLAEFTHAENQRDQKLMDEIASRSHAYPGEVSS